MIFADVKDVTNRIDEYGAGASVDGVEGKLAEVQGVLNPHCS